MKPFFKLFSPEGDGSTGGGGSILGGNGGGTTPAEGGQSGDAGSNPAPFDFRSAIGDDGAFKSEWTKSLPADLQDYAGSLGKYPNVTELLRGFGNAQKVIGSKGQPMKPPGPDAKPEELAAWNKLVGVPDTPDGYGIKKPEKMPEGVEWNEEQVKEFSGLAHKLGLTPTQAQALLAWDTERAGKGVSKGKGEIEAYISNQREDLKKSWGDKFDNNVERARLAAGLLGLDANDPEISNSAKMIKALHAASQLISEDKFPSSSNAGAGLTGEEQAEDIRRNPNNPLHAAFHGKEGPQRQAEAAEKMWRLKGVNPGKIVV